MAKLTNETAAAQVRKAARRSIRELAANERAFNDDDVRSLTFDDANDLFKLAALVEAGKLAAAEKMHDRLDTAVRDLVPASVYYYLGGEGA